MRKSLAATVTVLCLLAAPAFAGEVTIGNGQAVWKSTLCTPPAVPPLLSGVGSEAAANDVNARVAQYNDYLQQLQPYMDCMSNEAQTDATAASSAVVASAQAQIAEVHQRAEAMGAALKK